MTCAMEKSLLLLLVFASAGSKGMCNVTEASLLVMLSTPNEAGSVESPSWQRGLEILPGAHVALEEIKHKLPEIRLRLVEVFAEGCNPTMGLTEFVRHITNSSQRIVGVVGLFCTPLMTTIASIAGHPGISLLQISGSSSPISHNSDAYPHHYRILSSSAYLTALSGILQAFNWTRIGVLCGQTHDSYYFRAAEAFVQLALSRNVTVLFYGEITATDIPKRFPLIKNLHHSKTKVTLVFLPVHEASEFLCAAYTQGFRWPEYAWIFLGLKLQELLSSIYCNVQTMARAAESVFLLEHQLEPSDENLRIISGKSYKEYYRQYNDSLQGLVSERNITLHRNLYANVLHDSVWAVALALNNSLAVLHRMNLTLQNYGPGSSTITEIIERELSGLSFPGALGSITHIDNLGGDCEPETVVNIFHIRNATAVNVGFYSPSDGKVVIDIDSFSLIPNDELESKYYLFPVFLNVLLSTLVGLTAVSITLLLVLFFYYRNEPEIKATSFQLSLFMFIGCYFVLFGTLSHIIPSGIVVKGGTRKFYCGFNVALSALGVDFVLATIFAKTLRIYRVFTYFGKTGKIWSDAVLVIIILLIISGKVILLVVWAVVDTNTLRDFKTLHLEAKPPYYEIVQYCYSRYIGIWLTTVLGYSGLLFLCLILLAFKTRKIRRENFKDTKKVNALIFTMIVIVCLATPLWWVLRATGDPNGSNVVVTIGYTTMAVVGQLYLIVPKTIPPFLRKIKAKCYRSPLSSKNSTAATESTNCNTGKQESSERMLV